MPACESEPTVLLTKPIETLYGWFDWTATDDWITSAVDLDSALVTRSGTQHPPKIFGAPHEITHWCTTASSNMWRMTFNTDYWNLTNVSFADVSPYLIESTLAVNKHEHEGGDAQYEEGDVFVLMTDEGNLAKVKVLGWSDASRGWPYEWRHRFLDLQYEVYSRPEANR
jgi:hypothetical protein